MSSRGGLMRVLCCGLLFAPRVLGSGQLPSFRAASGEAARGAARLMGARWWAHVGDRVFTAPDEDGLSQDIGDYYCAMGSESALTDRMRQRRVGGSGLWHIFHLPEGPALLNVSHRGGRRNSFSSLIQLRSEDVLLAEFPVYKPKECKDNGGTAAHWQAEGKAMKELTPESYLDILKKIVTLGNDGGTVTRAYSDKTGTAKAQSYIKEQFAAMGLSSCLQKFSFQGTSQANVVAVIPGKSTDSVTVGAHYDSRPFKGSAPGAEDNGSGLAALLSIAKAYVKGGIKPEKTVHFVAFAGEEAGLLGSEHFARQLEEGKHAPEFCKEDTAVRQSFLHMGRRASAGDSNTKHQAIVLDEVGWLTPKYKKDTVNLESYDWSPEILDYLACSSKSHNGDSLEIVHSNSPFGSDHMSFLSRGMKAALVINGDDEGYPNYHQSSDTIENVTPEYANRIAKMVLGALIRVAGDSDN